jgi:hypothetical protein
MGSGGCFLMTAAAVAFSETGSANASCNGPLVNTSISPPAVNDGSRSWAIVGITAVSKKSPLPIETKKNDRMVAPRRRLKEKGAAGAAQPRYVLLQ